MAMRPEQEEGKYIVNKFLEASDSSLCCKIRLRSLPNRNSFLIHRRGVEVPVACYQGKATMLAGNVALTGSKCPSSVLFPRVYLRGTILVLSGTSLVHLAFLWEVQFFLCDAP